MNEINEDDMTEEQVNMLLNDDTEENTDSKAGMSYFTLIKYSPVPTRGLLIF